MLESYEFQSTQTTSLNYIQIHIAPMHRIKCSATRSLEDFYEQSRKKKMQFEYFIGFY